MMSQENSFVVNKDDVTNYHQAQSAAHTVMNLLVNRGFAGSVAQFLMQAIMAYGFRPEFDKRTKEGREYAAAEANLIEAASRFDAARKAAKAKNNS